MKLNYKRDLQEKKLVEGQKIRNSEKIVYLRCSFADKAGLPKYPRIQKRIANVKNEITATTLYRIPTFFPIRSTKIHFFRA